MLNVPNEHQSHCVCVMYMCVSAIIPTTESFIWCLVYVYIYTLSTLGVSTLVIQHTGSGKSLCYQLPAYLYAKKRSPCITLVISPLISLMEDQICHFPTDVRGACLHNNQSKSKRDKIMRDVIDGKVHVLLLSPEALVRGAFWTGSRLEGSLPPVAFACIDEVHCISEWSHNFRFSYFQIKKVHICDCP